MTRTRRLDWQWVVRVVAALAIVALGLAIADVQRSGFVRPWTVVVGLVGTAFVNRVYVAMAQRGRVLEAIDIAEAPLVALGLLLPPGEAVLTFALASLLIELHLDRARIKKVFNVGIRIVGAALFVVTLSAFGVQGRLATTHALHAREVVAAGVGALGYTAFTAVAIALVVASVQERLLRSVLREGLDARLLVSAVATTIGIAGAGVAVRAPVGLVGILAVLILLSASAHSAERLQRESERVRHLLDTTTRIQSADVIEDQEVALVEGARDALLWKDVEVRDRPPSDDECGRLLYKREGAERWLVIHPQPGSDPWRSDDDNVVDLLARSAEVAYERSALQQDLARQALMDPLTGVANRRHFDHEIDRIADSRRGYGIVLCDLDHFKTVNDRLGHDAGDQLLQIAVARLAASVRSGDLIARLGGDEFAILLPGVTSREALQRVVDNISAKLDQPVQVGRWQLSNLPCSLGVAAAPRDGRVPRDVLAAADASMYDAKRGRKAGRSRLTVSLPGERQLDLSDDRRRHIQLAKPRLSLDDGTAISADGTWP